MPQPETRTETNKFAELGLARGQAAGPGQAEAHLDGWLDWYLEIGWRPGVALVCAELGFDAAREIRDPQAVAPPWKV